MMEALKRAMMTETATSTEEYSELTDTQLEAEAKRLTLELRAVLEEGARRVRENTVSLVKRSGVLPDEEFTKVMAEHNLLHQFFSFGKR